MRSAREQLRVRAGLVWVAVIVAAGAAGCGGDGGGGGGDITDPPAGGTELYVSTTGNDNNPGTRALPMATINTAIQAAPRSGADIFVAAGSYTDPVRLRSKMDLHGGYDPATWARDPAAFPTILEADSRAILSDEADSLTIDGFRLTRTNSSNRVLVDLRGSVKLELFDNQFTVARGDNGTTRLVVGEPVANGGVGGGGDDASGCPPDNVGGRGGAGNPHAGGTGGRGGAAGGFNGAGGAGPAPGGGGGGGSTFNDGERGGSGGGGAPGENGAGGSGFIMSGSTFLRADGLLGTPGTAGSGGGAGGGGAGSLLFACGGGGGGGGGGGEGGMPSGWGFGGDASIAILVREESDVSLRNNVITTGGGGNGGEGPLAQVGGTGGLGGAGGSAPGPSGAGGRGGSGGDGGPGGIGGSGGGGPSIGIVLEEGSTLDQTNNTFNIGPAGTGAAGPGSPGADSEAAQVKQVSRPGAGPTVDVRELGTVYQ